MQMGIHRILVVAATLWACATLNVVYATPQLAVDVVSTSTGVELLPPGREQFDPDGPPGWRMVDRFRGFRFAATLPASTSAEAATEAMNSVSAAARKLRCFGWMQADTPATLVGEARCPKTETDALHRHLHTLSTTLELKEYASTKIRFHFPTFRVLQEPRYKYKTCFPTPPHACRSSSTSTTTSTTKDEL